MINMIQKADPCFVFSVDFFVGVSLYYVMLAKYLKVTYVATYCTVPTFRCRDEIQMRARKYVIHKSASFDPSDSISLASEWNNRGSCRWPQHNQNNKCIVFRINTSPIVLRFFQKRFLNFSFIVWFGWDIETNSEMSTSARATQISSRHQKKILVCGAARELSVEAVAPPRPQQRNVSFLTAQQR